MIRLPVSRAATWGFAIGLALASGLISPQVTTAAENTKLQEAFRDQLVKSRTRIEGLLPWQVLLFNSEVLTQAESFVREFRPQGAGYQVEVDDKLLRNYLSFQMPRLTGQERPRLAARVEAEAGCIPCGEALPALKSLIESRFEARGAKLDWVKDQDLPRARSVSRTGLVAELPVIGPLREVREARGLHGLVVLRMESVIDRDDESGLELHPEDRRLRLLLSVAGGETEDFRKFEFQVTDSTSGSARKLLLETFSALGGRWLERQSKDSASAAMAASGPGEMFIRVSGVRDYFLLTQLKSQIQLALGGLQAVTERRMARGSVILAFRPAMSAAEVRTKLSGLQIGSQKLSVGDWSEGSDGPELEGKIP